MTALVAAGCFAMPPILEAECYGPVRPPIEVNGAFCGVARDTAGDLLTGSELDLLDTAKQVVANARTDKAGHFRFPDVVPGTYQIGLYGFQSRSNRIAIGQSGGQCLQQLEVTFNVVSECEGNSIRRQSGTLRVNVDVKTVYSLVVDGQQEVPASGRHSFEVDLEEGTHHIELDGGREYEDVAFDVTIRAHRTTTRRAKMKRWRP